MSNRNRLESETNSEMHVASNSSQLSENSLKNSCRFRYKSEIDKKSYSFLENTSNNNILFRVKSLIDIDLVIKLFTKSNKKTFFCLYTPTNHSLSEHKIRINRSNEVQDIKVDIGIQKLKKTDALKKIAELYTEFSLNETLEFYDENSNCVLLKASLMNGNNEEPYIYHIITGSNKNENSEIKIESFTPRNFDIENKKVTIVLKKQLTDLSDLECLLHVNGNTRNIQYEHRYNISFVFDIPIEDLGQAVEFELEMKNTKGSDKVTIDIFGNNEPAPKHFRSSDTRFN